MPGKKSIRPTLFFSKDNSQFVKDNVYFAIVYDVEENLVLQTQDILVDDTLVQLQENAIIARIIPLHNGIPSYQLPLFFPIRKNIPKPVMGEIVKVTYIRGIGYWEDISSLSNTNISQQFVDEESLKDIESKYGDPSVSIIPQKTVDVKNQYNFPIRTISPIHTLQGDVKIEGRFANGILFTRHDQKYAEIALFNGRQTNRPDELNVDNAIILSSFKNIDSIIFNERDRSFIFDNIDDSEQRKNLTYQVSEDTRTISKNNAVYFSDRNLIVYGKIKLRLLSDRKIEILSNEDIDIIARNNINIETSGNITLKSDKTISLQAKNLNFEIEKNINIKSNKFNLISSVIEIGKTITERSGRLLLGDGRASILLNTFINTFLTHTHPVIGTATGIPIASVTPDNYSTKVKA